MNALLVTLLLFVPFILVGAVTGIIYLISGYKKGLYRSLFSLGITVVSILVSILLANIISTAVSGPVVNLLPVDSLADELGVLSSFALTMIQGAVKVALAFVFFVILLFIALIVLKLVGNRIKWEKLDMKDPDDKKMKFAGLAVRAVDTLLVTFMLLLPFYGSLAVLMPSVYVSSGTASAPVDDNMIVASTAVYSEGDSMQDIVDAINHHPLVSAYRIGPTDWVMRSLSDMGGDLENVNAIEAADTISRLTGLLTAFSNVDGDERYEILHQICDILKDDVIGEDWCYSLVIAAKSDFEKMVDEAAKNDPDAAEIRTYLDMLDMSREEFDANATAIVDFISYAIDNNFDKFYETSDYTALSEDFYKELGSLINCSKQAISLKKLFYIKAAEDIYVSTSDDTTGENSFITEEDYAAINADRKAFAQTFVDTYFKDGKVKKADYSREGEAFMLAFFSGSYGESVDAFLRHPLFGAESIKKYINSSAALNDIDIYNSLYYVNEEFFKNNEKITSYLQSGLSVFEDISITEGRYSDYMKTVFSVLSYADSPTPFGLYVNANDKALEIFVDQAKSDLAKAPVLYDVLYAICECNKAGELTDGTISVSAVENLVKYGKDTSLWPERIVTLEDCGEKISYYDEEGNLIQSYENEENYAIYVKMEALSNAVEGIVSSENCTALLSYITKTKGAAPYGISGTLTDKEKALFKQLCENIYNEKYIDASKIDYSLEGSSSQGSQIIVGGNGTVGGSIVVGSGSSDGVSSVVIGNGSGDGGYEIEFDGSSVIGSQGGMYYGIEVPYGYCYDTDEYGFRTLRPLTEDEIAESNASLKESLDIIKKFMGI